MTKLLDLETTFTKFLVDQDLVDQKLMLMVSGGEDSMVLLAVALKACGSENLAVFHLNHNVRTESVKDLIFVQKICSTNNITFFSETLSSNSVRTENDWRKARKTYSQQVSKEFGARRILTAHHATDLVETMIFRITKGCGPAGLSPFDTTTKPFWGIPKTEIIKYAEANKLEWREDITNNNIVHERNLIRHEVLPALRQITPNLEKVFVRESEIFAQVDDFLQSQPVLAETELSLTAFSDLHPLLQSEWLRRRSGTTVSQGELQDCLKWLLHDPAGNSCKQIGKVTLVIENNQITLQN